MDKQKGNILIILVFVAALAVGVIFYLKAKSPTSSTTSYIKPSTTQPISTKSAEQTKTFKSSSVMKFNIVLPTSYHATEKFGSVIISNSVGEISVGKNGTNFSNLNDYIKNSRNNLDTNLTERKDLKINGLEAISGLIEKEKIYLIYAENTVYLISTKTKSLFNDLDKIAQSFRYTP